MTNQTEKIFVNGLIFKDPRPGAPEFIKANLSIKREELIEFLQSQTDEWINVDVKESKGGKNYCEVNTFVPKKKDKSVNLEKDLSSLPF